MIALRSRSSSGSVSAVEITRSTSAVDATAHRLMLDRNSIGSSPPSSHSSSYPGGGTDREKSNLIRPFSSWPLTHRAYTAAHHSLTDLAHGSTLARTSLPSTSLWTDVFSRRPPS